MEVLVTANDDYRLWVLLSQAHDAIVKAIEKELRPIGISMIQAAVLFIAKAADLATPAEISRWLFREPHTVSGLLGRMEKEGLVKQVKDLPRKNLIRIVLTERGEEAYKKSREMKVIREVMSSLSLRKRQSLRAYLETLRDKALELEAIRPSRRPPFP